MVLSTPRVLVVFANIVFNDTNAKPGSAAYTSPNGRPGKDVVLAVRTCVNAV